MESEVSILSELANTKPSIILSFITLMSLFKANWEKQQQQQQHSLLPIPIKQWLGEKDELEGFYWRRDGTAVLETGVVSMI